MHGKILFDEQPLVIPTSLAMVVGLNESIILQQLHYWLQKSTNIIDGIPWVYNTHDEWQRQFPFWSVATIRRTISTLENEGIVLAGNFNQRKFDKTKWYTINYDVLEKMQYMSSASAQNEQTSCSKRADEPLNLSGPIPETTTEITTENTGSSGVRPGVCADDGIVKVMKVYQDNIHPITGSIEVDNLTDMVDTYSAAWVEAAITESVKNGVRKLSYITAILERWRSSGIDEPWLKKKNANGKTHPPSQIAWEEVYDKLIVNRQKGIEWSNSLIGKAVQRTGYMNLLENGAKCMAQFVQAYNEVIDDG